MVSSFRVRCYTLVLVVFIVTSVSVLAVHSPFGGQKLLISHPPNVAGPARPLNTYGKLPLVFEANAGQTDSSVRFLAHGNGYTLFLTAADPLLSFAGKTGQSVLRFHLAGAYPHPQVIGLQKLPGKTNYFIGSDASSWHTNVPTYAKVMYQNVYSGVNLVYYGNQSQLEYDFMLAPGVSPSIIRLTVAGEQSLYVDAQGNLVLRMANGEVLQPRPFIYQQIAGSKQAIPGRYVLLGANQVGFAVGAYDTTRPLIIDPVLTYSTYLGGNGDDQAYGVALDSAGNAYVTGYTYSANFPTKNAFQATYHGGGDVFVAKLNAGGNALVYSTYLGGRGFEIWL